MKTSNLNLDKAQQKAQTEARYRAKRKARKQQLADLHKSVVEREQAKKPKTPFKVGFSKRRIRRDGEVEELPTEFAFILKACEELIDNKKRFAALYAWGGDGINNIQCRRLIARVLACILPNTDLIGGRIGEPTEAGMKTISWNQVEEDYALRFGEVISPNSLGKALKYLKRAGYLTSERINVRVDEEGEIRSAPAYKQLTGKFFNDLKVVRYSNICKLIVKTRKRQHEKGNLFHWISRRALSELVQEIYNSTKLNEIADVTAHIFHTQAIAEQLYPH
ncbi:hypothetical protein [Vibrio sp. WXL210]|uniref:hypothetical protein n=1 Tax=Vibrio sp. WXL210 TaxID=3450709 RepID=UPI003EC5A91A